VKGKNEAVYIFEILDGDSEDIRELKINTKEDFNQGIQHYKNKEFKEARKLFEQVFEVNPVDMAASLYIKRCSDFIELGAADDWDGIEKYN
jgi:hypothetical protein